MYMYGSNEIEASVRRVIHDKADDLLGGQILFERRHQRRCESGTPAVGVVGYGRHGKDTVAKLIHQHSNLGYAGSTSDVVAPYLAYAVGKDVASVFAERHDYRHFWFDWCNEFRREYAETGPTVLCRLLLGESDLAVGLRNMSEVEGCVNKKFVNYWIWVEDPRRPADSTVAFDWPYMRRRGAIRIVNDGTLEDLEQKVINYCKLIEIFSQKN